MDWNLLWQFGLVLFAGIALLGAFFKWVTDGQMRVVTGAFNHIEDSTTSFMHGLDVRIRALEAENDLLKPAVAILNDRQSQVSELKETLSNFGTKLDTVATKLEVVTDRLGRITNGLEK